VGQSNTQVAMQKPVNNEVENPKNGMPWPVFACLAKQDEKIEPPDLSIYVKCETFFCLKKGTSPNIRCLSEEVCIPVLHKIYKLCNVRVRVHLRH
jgi:hypothetical protein